VIAASCRFTRQFFLHSVAARVQSSSNLSAGGLKICSALDFSFFKGNYPARSPFSYVAILSRKVLLAIAAVIDVALQKDGRPIPAKTLAKRHGLPPRHLELVLQKLVRSGILKGIRGPQGGYRLERERHDVTVNDILLAAGTVDAPDEEPKSELVVKVVRRTGMWASAEPHFS
jgi:Rrf2 family protein